MVEDNIIDYGEDLQKLLISYMMSDSELFVRSNHILKPEYWGKRFRNSVQLLKDHYESYKTIPTFEQIKAEAGVGYDKISIQETTEQSQWYFDTVESFCKHKAMENLILNQGPDLIEKGQYGTVEEIVKDNMLITLQTDLGTSYFSNPLERLTRMKDRTGIHSTGWQGIDSVLYGGFERGTLNFFAGGPGCVIGSTKIKVYDNDLDSEYTTTIEKVKNSFVDGRYKVNSPDGYVNVTDVVTKENKVLMTISLASRDITVSDDHLFQLVNGSWVYAKYLEVGEKISTPNSDGIITSIETLSTTETVYDLSVDHPNHRYYTNDMCSHNTGKSLFMQNLCLNWVYQGFNVLYISLELSEELVGLRFDAMISNKATKDILRNIDDSALELSLLSKKHVGKEGGWGKLQIKKMPESSTTVNNIRAYIKEYEAQTKIKVDAIAVDYLDLLRPNNGKINLSDIFIKDKYVSEELRALASELNIYSVSASQLGRAAAEEAQFSVAHIAGGISKINTADNVMAIYTNPAMKERGEYQIQFLKTRSSAGVGKFVMMKYDNMTMRITDLTEDNKTDYSNQQSEKVTSILNTVNRNNQNTSTTSDKQQNNKDRLAKLTGMTKR